MNKTISKSILHRPVDFLSSIGGLGINALHYENIKTIGKLVRTKASKLRRIPNCGDVTTARIANALDCYGLNLKPESLCFGENLRMVCNLVSLLSFKEPVIKTLERHGILTIGQLILTGRSHLFYTIGFDHVTLTKIEKTLALYNLSLKP